MSLINVQSSFTEVIDEVKGGIEQGPTTFWVSVRQLEHAEDVIKVIDINVERNEDEILFTATKEDKSAMEFRQKGAGNFEIRYNGKMSYISVPKQKYLLENSALLVKTGSVTALDVSDIQKLALLGTTKGNVIVYSLQTSSEMKEIVCHEGFDIQKTVFFPSGSVMLTAGLDLRIKVWDIRSGQCVRTFIGHTGRINDVATIGTRGRNFVSCSADGSVKLWECGSGTQVKEFVRITKRAAVSCVALADSPELKAQYSTEDEHDCEFETKGVLVFAGYANGIITEWDVFQGCQRAVIPSIDDSGVSSILTWDISSEKYIVAGYENGTVCVWNSPYKESPLRSIVINKGIAVNFVKRHANRLVISSNNDTLIAIDFEKWIKSNSQTCPDIVTYSGVGDYQKTSVAAFGANQNALYTLNKDNGLLVVF